MKYEKEITGMTASQYDEFLEQLLEEPCYVIDFLPRQVPADSTGQYFAVERFTRENPQISGLPHRFADLMLRLNCYFDLAVGDGEHWSFNPAPEELYRRIAGCPATAFANMLIPGQDSLITFNGDDLYMTLYHPSEELLQTVKQLAAALGLFVRIGANQP